MGDIHSTFTSDSSQIEKVYEKLKRMDLELIDRQRKIHEQSKDGANAFAKWGEEQKKFITNLPAMALNFIGIEKAIDKVTDAFGRLREERLQATRAASDFSLNLARGVGPADAAHLDEINEKFERMERAGLLKKDQSLALYGAITSAGPGLSYEARSQVFGRAAGFGVFATPELGAGAGRLAAAGIAPGKAAAMAFQAQKLSGGLAGDVLSGETIAAARELVNVGAVGSVDEGIAMAITMAQSGKVSPRQIDALARAVSSTERIIPKTPQEALKARFQATKDPKEKLRQLMAGGDMARAVLPEQAAKLGAVDWSRQGANLATLRGDAIPDLAASEMGRTAIAAQLAAANMGQAETNLAGVPRDYDAWVRANMKDFPQRLNYLFSTTPRDPAAAAAKLGVLPGGNRALTREQFETLYVGPGRMEIGGETYNSMLAGSRAANPQEWSGAPDRETYAEMVAHLRAIAENTKPEPGVVLGRHTEGR